MPPSPSEFIQALFFGGPWWLITPEFRPAISVGGGGGIANDQRPSKHRMKRYEKDWWDPFYLSLFALISEGAAWKRVG